MEKNELYHYGKKGMQWGVRRYQNPDGSLTAAGKKRYDRDTADLSNDKKSQYKANPDRWVKEDLERSKRVADASAETANRLKQATENRGTSRSKKKMNLSSMSDKEMRDRINRELLERQYDDMFNPKKVSRGKEIARKTLEVAGATLAITGSALGIAVAIKELKG